MSPRLKGVLRLPGDEAISHQLLVLGAMAEGRTFIDNLSDSEDVLATLACLRALGVEMTADAGRATVKGSRWRGLVPPRRGLDAGSSVETMSLLLGVLAGSDIMATIDGDDRLRRRPMAWVALPLRLMGADIRLKDGQHAPASVSGAALRGIDFRSPTANAHIKTAVLLAGLLAIGETSVTEPVPSRDHTERLLPVFGARVKRAGLKVSVQGGLHLGGGQMIVPGDPSLAAVWAVAATLLKGSELRLADVSLNPTRLGFLSALRRMGAELKTEEKQAEGEPRGDILIRSAPLRAADLSADLADDLPVLALAATQAEGVSRFSGLSKLSPRQDERFLALARLLQGLGADARIEGDDFIVTGPCRLKAAKTSSEGDPRLAMTALIAGLLSGGNGCAADERCAGKTYPTFAKDLTAVL